MNDKMITIDIEFYDKETEFMVEEILFHLPEEIIFRAANTENIHEINARMFDVSSDMKDYIVQKFPAYKKQFDLYDYNFSGRHGLNPEYD